MVPSKERLLETATQGRAFLDATRAAWPCEALAHLDAAWDGAVALPVPSASPVPAMASPAKPRCTHLHALTANWISAGVRLIPLGQTNGQRLLAALEPAVTATATRALETPLDDVAQRASCHLASMRHETQYTRLFRS